MGINYGSEYARFRRELKHKHALYEELGMTSEQVEALDAFDLAEFRSDLVFRKHNQSLDLSNADDKADKLPGFKKYTGSLSVPFVLEFQGRYPWIEEILDPKLHRLVLQLDPEDLAIWDAYVFHGLTQKEIASLKQVDRGVVRRSLDRVRRILSASKKNK